MPGWVAFMTVQRLSTLDSSDVPSTIEADRPKGAATGAVAIAPPTPAATVWEPEP